MYAELCLRLAPANFLALRQSPAYSVGYCNGSLTGSHLRGVCPLALQCSCSGLLPVLGSTSCIAMLPRHPAGDAASGSKRSILQGVPARGSRAHAACWQHAGGAVRGESQAFACLRSQRLAISLRQQGPVCPACHVPVHMHAWVHLRRRWQWRQPPWLRQP